MNKTKQKKSAKQEELLSRGDKQRLRQLSPPCLSPPLILPSTQNPNQRETKQQQKWQKNKLKQKVRRGSK